MGGRDLRTFNLREFPRQPVVQRDLHAVQPVAATRVRVPVDGNRLNRVVLGGADNGVVLGIGHGAVDVHRVERVLRLVPPLAFVSRLQRCHLRGKHGVVVVVVEVVRWLVTNRDLGQPLYAARLDPAGDDHAQRVPVVRKQVLVVRLVSDDDIGSRIQSHAHWDACAVSTVSAAVVTLAVGKLSFGSPEAHMLSFGRGFRDAALVEKHAERHAGPQVGGDCTRPPIGPCCLLEHVHLLAAVSGADQRDRERLRRHFCDLVHREGLGLFDVSCHRQRMRPRIELGNRSSIAHEVQVGRRDETSVEKESEGRLAVQGNPRAPNLHRVPHEPAVSGSYVPFIYFCRSVNILRLLQCAPGIPLQVLGSFRSPMPQE
mmetsp:Transcript_865/g.1525  ORF Transcript_865/g.1525 Transcript_865/m.1525 type:complete len:372 (-) Transcript_865:149-1264(-)